MARVALTAGTAAQLVVDAAAFVALGADDHQAAGGEALALSAAICALISAILASRSAPSRPAASRLDAHFEIAAELDVGAAAGHVGGDGDGAGQAGIGDDMGFLLVVAGIEHVHGADVLLAQQLGQHFGFFDRGGAHQHGLAALLAFLMISRRWRRTFPPRCGRWRLRRPGAAPARWWAR